MQKVEPRRMTDIQHRSQKLPPTEAAVLGGYRVRSLAWSSVMPSFRTCRPQKHTCGQCYDGGCGGCIDFHNGVKVFAHAGMSLHVVVYGEPIRIEVSRSVEKTFLGSCPALAFCACTFTCQGRSRTVTSILPLPSTCDVNLRLV